MVGSFLSVLGTVGLVVGVGSLALSSGRRAPWHFLLVIAAGSLATFAGFSLGWNISPGLRWVLSAIWATLVVAFFARRLGTTAGLSSRLSVGLALVALALLSGNWLISSAQGWHLTESGARPNFRFPFNDDVERNVVLVDTLARGSSESPYLAHSRLNYQIFWHALASLFVQGSPGEDSGPRVAGVARATGYVFLVVLLAWLALLRPSLARRLSLGFPMLLLFWFHADLYNVLVSLLLRGTVGIEADWSVARASVYRYVSLEFLELVAPQHLFFFLFGVSHLCLHHYKRRLRVADDRWLSALTATFAFLASPLLYALFLFPPAIYRTVRARRLSPVATFASETAVAFVAYRLVTGNWASALFIREGATNFSLLPWMGWGWSLLPVIGLTALGPLGLWLTAWAIRNGNRREAWRNPWLVYLVAGLFFFNFVFTSPEIKRHFGWVAMLLGLLFVIDTATRPRLARFGLGISLGLLAAIPLQGYFLYCYLGKPSLVPSSSAGKDHFEMNRLLAGRFPGQPVMAAVSSEDGILMPLATRVTASFSVPSHAWIHASLSREQSHWLSRARVDKAPVPYARKLGYELLIWDQVAENAWGDSVKRRFVAESNLLARVGSVSLYRLRDVVLDRGGKPMEIADRLADAGWDFEAIELYGEIARQEGSADARAKLSRSMTRLGLQPMKR